MRKLLTGIILIFAIASVSAFPASIEAVDRTATAEDDAEFRVTVENDFAEKRSFRISSVSSPPPTGSWFSYSGAQATEPGERASFKVRITPPERAIQQNYRFEINLRTLTGDHHEVVSDYFKVNQQDDLKITSSGLNKNSYRPGESVKTNLTVYNTAATSINYDVRVSVLEQDSTQAGAIASGTERFHRFTLQIPEDTGPGTYVLQSEIIRNGEVVHALNQTLEVVRVHDIVRSTEKVDKVLEFQKTISATNRGNFGTQVELNQTIPGYMKPLTNFNTTADEVGETEEGTIYYWRFDLEPGETAAVSYATRYWITLPAIGLLLAAVFVLKRLYTGVSFSKQVENQDGKVKVHLELSNSSGSSMENLTVKDFVPDIASVEDKFPMAKPDVRETGSGTRLTWEIDELEPGDQRVLEYTIKPLVEVEGGVTLSGAELESEGRRIKQTGDKTVEFNPE